MFDKEQIKAAVDAVGELGTSEAEAQLFLKNKCVAPLKVIYVLLSNCVTINNGACPDWDFCEPLINVKK
ncbi:MAG: hypothetical protein IBX71_00035 [Candidatus Desulforudis sp.]|nr:hypothetical protein [Desulforudis sp.]